MQVEKIKELMAEVEALVEQKQWNDAERIIMQIGRHEDRFDLPEYSAWLDEISDKMANQVTLLRDGEYD